MNQKEQFFQYDDLSTSEKILKATKKVWECTEEWDSMYTEWASVEFSQLNVEDVDSGTELIEFDLEQARFARKSSFIVNEVNGQYYKQFTIVIYNSRGVQTVKLLILQL